MSKYCVSEGTMITLKDKTTKPIEEIIIGEELLVFDLKTLQKTQKYNILVKLNSNNFEGIFQNSIVKNIWTNMKDKYYLINNKLKITGDHILLSNRDNKYYWTKVEKLQLNDLLFTEMNIFECIKSIEIVNKEIDVYNLEVNTYYNYFADSYLIHNGAPCSACDACGSQSTPEFEWNYYAYGADIGTIYVYWLKTSNNNLNQLRTPITGQQHSGDSSTTETTLPWLNYTEDLSTYSGQTGRIVFAYKTGNGFRQDIQLDDMELRGTTLTTPNIDLDPGTLTGRDNWEKYSGPTGSGYSTTLSYSSQLQNTSNWSDVTIGTTSSNIWNYDHGGTPSQNTGGKRDVSGSTSGKYLYFEATSPNNTANRYYWLRTKSTYILSGGGDEGDEGDDY